MNTKLILGLVSAAGLVALAASSTPSSGWTAQEPVGAELRHLRRTLADREYHYVETYFGPRELTVYWRPRKGQPDYVMSGWIKVWPDGRIMETGGEADAIDVIRRDGSKLELPELDPKPVSEAKFSRDGVDYLLRYYSDGETRLYFMRAPDQAGSVWWRANGTARKRVVTRQQLETISNLMRAEPSLFPDLKVPPTFEQVPSTSQVNV